jgi:hypothetical protein
MGESDPQARVALFQSREIRRTLHNDEWWFVITDIIAALTDVAIPSDYWKTMRRRDPALGLDSQGGDKVSPPLGWHSLRRAAEAPVLEHARPVGRHRAHSDHAGRGHHHQAAPRPRFGGHAQTQKNAKDGCDVAGRTRKDIEKQSGKPVISPDNFKQLAVKKVSRVKKIKGSEG